jgi:signal transduction histidine kinase
MTTFLRPWVRSITWRRLAHVTLDFFVGLVPFVVVVTGIALAFGLSIIWVGIPVALLTLAFANAFGRFERARANSLLNLDVQAPPRKQPSTPSSFWSRWWARLSDGASWRATLYSLVLFVWGTFTLVFVPSFLALSVVALTLPIWNGQLPDGDADLFGARIDGAAELGAIGVAGLVGLLLWPWVVNAAAAVDAGLVRSLLGATRRSLEQRVEHLEVSRATTVASATDDRRRLERDLHDGVQPQLVNLAMQIGLAKERMADDPERARQLLDDAHLQAKQAIGTVRDLARGVYPAILADRGLDAALSALAAKSPVPVHIDVRMATRPPIEVEAAAYFIVAEALTNVAKHAGARHAWVLVEQPVAGAPVHLLVTDDGVGGADPDRGSGLRGLRDRVAALDGRFALSSPPGGPTHLDAVLPLPRA